MTDMVRDMIEANKRITELEIKCRLYEAALNKADKTNDDLRMQVADWKRTADYNFRLFMTLGDQIEETLNPGSSRSSRRRD